LKRSQLVSAIGRERWIGREDGRLVDLGVEDLEELGLGRVGDLPIAEVPAWRGLEPLRVTGCGEGWREADADVGGWAFAISVA
jgi:hypothetical protein